MFFYHKKNWIKLKKNTLLIRHAQIVKKKTKTQYDVTVESCTVYSTKDPTNDLSFFKSFMKRMFWSF